MIVNRLSMPATAVYRTPISLIRLCDVAPGGSALPSGPSGSVDAHTDQAPPAIATGPARAWAIDHGLARSSISGLRVMTHFAWV
jgi:hypothetical protein